MSCNHQHLEKHQLKWAHRQAIKWNPQNKSGVDLWLLQSVFQINLLKELNKQELPKQINKKISPLLTILIMFKNGETSLTENSKNQMKITKELLEAA